MHDRACETAGYSGTRHQNPFSVEQNCDGRGIFIITMTAKMTYRHRYLCHDSISENYSWPPPPLSSLPSASASPSSISHQHHHHHYHNNNNYHHPSRNINSTIVVIIHHHYHDHNYNNTANNYHYQRVWEESSWWDADQTISCLVTQSLLWVPLSHLEGRLVMRGEGQVYHICIFYVIRSISLGKTVFFWAVRTDLKLISAHGPKIILYIYILGTDEIGVVGGTSFFDFPSHE